MVVEKFQIYSVKITDKYIFESKNWICSFLLTPQAKLSLRFLILPHRQKKITHCSWRAFSEDLFFPAERGEEDYGVDTINQN